MVDKQAAFSGEAGAYRQRIIPATSNSPFSLYLAQHILQIYHFPPSTGPALFDFTLLARSSVLELGCGTGLLAILLSPLCRSYTASDLLVNLQLCTRNLQLNSINMDAGEGSRVSMEEIDWFDMSAERKCDTDNQEGYDLILAVDCVFNEALAGPLVDTLTRYCRAGSRTIALVVVELRSSDVVSTPKLHIRRDGAKIRYLTS